MLNYRQVLTLRRMYSKSVVISSLERKLPVDQFVMRKWYKWEDKVAIECGTSRKKLTYKELKHKSNSLGVALAQLGFKKRTALLAMPNCPEFLVALLGALQAGMTVSPVDPLSQNGELKYQIADAGIHCVLTTPEYMDSIQSAVERSEIPVICTGDIVEDGVISFEQLSNIRDPYELLLPTKEEKADQLAILAYSSQTNGMPKRVGLRHSSIIADLQKLSHPGVNVLLETTDKHQDVVPAVLQFSHVFGITSLLLRSLKMGAKILSLPMFRQEGLLGLLANNKDLVLHGVPTVMNFLANDDRVTPELLRSVNVITYSGAPSSRDDLHKLAEKARRSLLQAYGVTKPLINWPNIDSTDGFTIGSPLPVMSGKVVNRGIRR